MNNNLNSVIVEGNLVKDAVFEKTSKGTEFCTFSLASNRYFKQGEEYIHEVSYFEIEVWGKLCTSSRGILTKGAGIRAVGRLKQDRWTDSDNKNRSKIKIIAEHVEAKPAAQKDSETEDVSSAEKRYTDPDIGKEPVTF